MLLRVPAENLETDVQVDYANGLFLKRR